MKDIGSPRLAPRFVHARRQGDLIHHRVPRRGVRSQVGINRRGRNRECCVRALRANPFTETGAKQDTVRIQEQQHVGDTPHGFGVPLPWRKFPEPKTDLQAHSVSELNSFSRGSGMGYRYRMFICGGTRPRGRRQATAKRHVSEGHRGSRDKDRSCKFVERVHVLSLRSVSVGDCRVPVGPDARRTLVPVHICSALRVVTNVNDQPGQESRTGPAHKIAVASGGPKSTPRVRSILFISFPSIARCRGFGSRSRNAPFHGSFPGSALVASAWPEEGEEQRAGLAGTTSPAREPQNRRRVPQEARPAVPPSRTLLP